MINRLNPDCRASDPVSADRPEGFFARAQVWLLMAVCFALPMKVAFIYTFSALLLLALLAAGGLGGKLLQVLRSRLCLAFLAYYLVFMLAMIWTEDVPAGWQMVDRQTPVLLFLLYWSCAQARDRERYLLAFVAGAAVCALLAHYNFLQLHFFPEWPRGVRVDKSAHDTAPFVDWIMYAPILALATYFAVRRNFEVQAWSGKAAALAVSCLLLSNLAFSGGRAGMVMFAVMAAAFVFERIRARMKAALICMVIFPAVLVGAYHSVDSFAERVDLGITDIRAFESNQNTSVGQRVVYWVTSMKLFLQHPLLGVGSGDFQDEYARIKPAEWAQTPDSFNPHNQFLMTAATTGLLGLVALLHIFYCAYRSRADARMIAVLAGFAVVCLFESYLWRSSTALTFSVLVALLARRECKSCPA